MIWWNPNEIPQSWQDLLAKLQESSPQCILAGGSLRDCYLGRKPEDLDFFIPYDAKKVEFDVPDECPWELKLYESGDSLSADGDSTVQDIIELTGFELPVQIIRCKEKVAPMERFKQFDFGLCQIAYDGNKVYVTDEFNKDVANHTFTLLRCDNLNSFLNSIDRYKKFREKYPWPLIIPETLELRK